MMDTNGGFQPDVDLKAERGSRSRSRSPLNKSPKERRLSSSRDSSVTRDRDRQAKGSRNRSGNTNAFGGGSSDDRRRSRAPSNRRVYVANIAYDCRWTDIKDLFREKVGDVSYVELFEDESGKFRGCGIVEFKDASSVQKAIDILHRYEFRGRQLVIKEDFDVERDKTGRPVTRTGAGGTVRSGRDRGTGSDNFGGGALNNPQYNTYGLSPQFLEALGINGPLSSRVFVANLDYKVTTKKLQDIFKMAGKVHNVELKTDKEGNSKGHGTVEFDHPVEAVQAISMFNGQKLYNRTMSVRMDKFREDTDTIPSKLPDGLQSVGKGLGAGGQPLHLGKTVGTNLGMMGIGSNVGNTANMNTGIGNMGTMGMASGNMGLMSNNQMGMVGGVGAAAGLGMGMGIGMGNSLTGDRNMMGGGMATGLAGGVAGMGLAGAAGGIGLGNAGAAGIGMGMTGGGSLMGGNLGTAMGNTSGAIAGNLGGGGGGGSGMGGGIGMGMAGNAGAGNSNVGGFGDYDRNFDRGEDNYRSPRTSDTIIVRNLPNAFTWQSLRDRFRDIGDVRYTEMKGRGTAVVRFSSEREAQRAVDLMHGSRIDGRAIEVHLY